MKKKSQYILNIKKYEWHNICNKKESCIPESLYEVCWLSDIISFCCSEILPGGILCHSKNIIKQFLMT